MGRINIELAPELLTRLDQGKDITLVLSGPSTSPELKANSLPSRIIAWAKRRKRFGLTDVEKEFNVTRAHASMLMSRMAREAYPIVRTARGEYAHEDKVE
jgi:hypothetical protein